MLAHRLATGLTLVAALLAILGLDELMAPWFPLWFLTSTVVVALSALEVIGLLDATTVKPSGNTVFGGVLALVLANWAPHIAAYFATDDRWRQSYNPSSPIDALAWPLFCFVGILMYCFVAQSAQFERPGGTMARIAGTLLSTAYVGLLGSFLIQFRWLPGNHCGMIALAALVATAKGSDTGAYAFGRIAGRHKLWPTLSPNKTVEGAIGGLVFGVGFSLDRRPDLGSAISFSRSRTSGMVVRAIGFGLVVGSAAQLGDLMESMIKRDCERKDASATLPGFGGVLDVMDSLLFAAPIGFGYWLIFGP